jgi:hypothetical protein
MMSEKETDWQTPSGPHIRAKDYQALRDLHKWHEKEFNRNLLHQLRFERIGPPSRAKMHGKVADFHQKACDVLLAFMP